MKVKDSLILEKFGDDYVVIPSDDTLMEFGSLITLNETSTLLWKMLQNETTIDDLADMLVKEYDIDKTTALTDVTEFVEILEDKNLLEK